MTEQARPTTFDIGTIENAKHAVFSTIGGNTNHRYVVSPTLNSWSSIYENEKLLSLHACDYKSVDFHCEDSDGKFFAFANVDCFDPPIAIIRASSLESAYEAFCDEFTSWMKIDDEDIKDYDDDLNYSASGVAIDTGGVNGVEVQLLSVHL